jgi:type IV secretory pathway VirB2 component (pilin)
MPSGPELIFAALNALVLVALVALAAWFAIRGVRGQSRLGRTLLPVLILFIILGAAALVSFFLPIDLSGTYERQATPSFPPP